MAETDKRSIEERKAASKLYQSIEVDQMLEELFVPQNLRSVLTEAFIERGEMPWYITFENPHDALTPLIRAIDKAETPTPYHAPLFFMYQQVEGKWISSEINQIQDRFDQNIYAIRDRNVDVVSEKALKAVGLIARKEIPVIIGGKADSSEITNFSLLQIPGTEHNPQFMPVVSLNPRKIEDASDASFQTDLVRTVGLMTQYPDKGYQRRPVEYMTEAVSLQERWAKATSDKLPWSDKGQEILRVLGEPLYYTNAGFDDWEKAIDSYSPSSPLPYADKRKLATLKASLPHFLATRHRFSETAYFSALDRIGPQFHYMKSQFRSESTAMVFLGISLQGEESKSV